MRATSKTGGIFIGGALIMVVFIVLCLTTFAVLSVVSARADAKMTERTMAAVGNYYFADAAAEEKLALIDAYLLSCAKECEQLPEGLRAHMYKARAAAVKVESVMAHELPDGGISLTYSVPVDGKQSLSVELLPVYPAEPGDARFIRRAWQVIYTAEWSGDMSLDVWGGNSALA